MNFVMINRVSSHCTPEGEKEKLGARKIDNGNEVAL